MRKNNRIRSNKESLSLDRPVPAVSKKIIPEKKWTFSFQSWEQRKLFGLKHKKVTLQWFVSLIKTLKDLSQKTIEEVILDIPQKTAYRIHPINWGTSSLNEEIFYKYIPENYRHKETEVIQFQIERSKGRAIGYFDSDYTFQIVLLDPAHNMQLSNYNNYTTVQTDFLPDCYDSILSKLAKIINKLNSQTVSSPEEINREVLGTLNSEGYNYNDKAIIT